MRPVNSASISGPYRPKRVMHDLRERTVMAFDYGRSKIGVAVGHEVTGTTTGIASIRGDAASGHFDRIGEMIHEWRPDALVVGLPLDESGGETPGSRDARAFGLELGRRFGLPVYWVNEFLTSQEAQSRLVETVGKGKRFNRRRQAGRDMLAAELILRSHFESSPPRG